MALAGCAVAIAACSMAPPLPPAAPVAITELPLAQAQAQAQPVTSFEQGLRDRAASQGRQGRLADAAVSWEILSVLRPEDQEVRDRLGDTRRLIDAALPERLQRGAQALKRGELDAAAAQYLAALALQPTHAQAADALRTIERERNRRNFLGKPSRFTLMRRYAGAAPPSVAAKALDRNELEHAAMLGTQGEFDAAIALIEHHLSIEKRDPAACRLLADTYAQKAEGLLPTDKAAAIASFEKSLRLDASNARASARLRQLKGGPGAAPANATGSVREGCNSGR